MVAIAHQEVGAFGLEHAAVNFHRNLLAQVHSTTFDFITKVAFDIKE